MEKAGTFHTDASLDSFDNKTIGGVTVNVIDFSSSVSANPAI